MATLWLVIQRELISNVLTSRFIIGFIICLLSTTAAVFVQVEDYKKRLAAYHIAVQEHQETVRTWELYSQINPKAHREPNPLSIFNVGMEKSGADLVSIQLATPIWEKKAQKHGSDNPFLYAMEGLANTGIVSYMNFVKQVRRYRETFIDFIKTEDREDPESLHIFPVREGLSQKPVDPNAVPRFEERPSYQSVIFPIGLLIIFNLLFFTAAQLSYLKCDLK